ncbi:M48 family metalloprotease [Sphingomonas daechungensis]|uniref:M48 family metalloprotease n=1 Tax=Sphingomonas daechungensis TaxID=1176646 RepID=UPI0031E75E9A
MRKAFFLLGGAALAASSIIYAQVPGRVLPPRYVQESQQEHPKLVDEFGGAETGQRASYVDSVGRRVASYSGVAPNAYRFTVLNSAVENAFATPGGYVYITRQLMALMDDESQLAFALGHEVGHVAANHQQARENYAQRSSVMGVLGAILGSVIGGGFGNAVAQMATTRSQMATLSFSRDQEYQADTLGLRYLVNAGYDPAGAAGVLAAITRATALEARVQGQDSRQTPEWASTHPLSENRVQRASLEARQTGRIGTGQKNRDLFLNQLEGVFVDDDPAQGIIDGRTFTHPDLRIYFAVPQGYLMQNGTTEVSISGSAGKAQFSGGRYDGSLENYIGQLLQALGGGQVRMSVPPARRTSVNGIPAAYTTAQAYTRSGRVDVSVFAYQWSPNTVYHFVMITRGGTGFAQFVPMVESIRRLGPNEAAQIRPRVIHVETVKPGDTVQALASRMAYRTFQLDRFLSLNNLAANSRLVPGQKVKLVVYGSRRA